MKIDVRASKKSKPITVEYDFGNNVVEAISLFNTDEAGDVVHSLFVREAVTQLRQDLAPLFKNGADAEQIVAFTASWRPRIKQRGTPTIVKICNAAKELTTEEKKELIRKLGMMAQKSP